MFDEQLLMLARLTLDEAQQKRLKIATAESCTGGLIAGLLTEIPGSSATVERGFIGREEGIAAQASVLLSR